MQEYRGQLLPEGEPSHPAGPQTPDILEPQLLAFILRLSKHISKPGEHSQLVAGFEQYSHGSPGFGSKQAAVASGHRAVLGAQLWKSFCVDGCDTASVDTHTSVVDNTIA